jgi:4-methylaminobutanoate oxidase (formaldehyde-forming)
MTNLPAHARIVIIGGGITGTSIAYHLARMGERDVLLIEKAELTSGSTWHAAGMVTHFHTSPTLMRMRKYSIDLYRALSASAVSGESGELPQHWHQVGSLRVASSADQLKFLQRQVGLARAIGLDVEIIAPLQALQLFPWMSAAELYGAIYLPTDGWIDPSGATLEIARRAKQLGAAVLTGIRVNGIERNDRGAVCGVTTEAGSVATECVINAAGMWGRQIGEMVGVNLPLTPLGHQHLLARVPAFNFPKTTPCLRDPENLVYLREEVGGLVIGGFELEPRVWAMDGVPWDFAGKLLPPDWELFAPIMDGATRRVPMLDRAEAVDLVHGPESITPDSKPLIGPVPGVNGFWAACGLSHTGFGAGAAIGDILAHWILHGEPPYDITELNVRRFGEIYRDREYACARAQESYKYYYWLRFPHDENERARIKRVSPLDRQLLELGAVFGEKNGWERANYFDAPGQGRRAGADQRRTGWLQASFFDQVGAEHQAARQAAALWDMTSFGKLDVRGPGALALLQYLADNDIDKPVGSVVYTQFLNARGGIESDLTIARLGQEHFRLVCGSNFVASDFGWMQLNLSALPELSNQVTIRDVTDELAVIGLWGPDARRVLERVTPDEVSNRGFPYMSARFLSVNGVEVWAQRVTYVGELGWELYVQPAYAARVWDALMRAGREFEIRPAGYKALESLRLEKGYRYWSTDITPSENPYEAGLGFCVKLHKTKTGLDGRGGFLGRDALLKIKQQGPQRKLAIITLEPHFGLYGGEPVYASGELVGRLRSGGYGYTVGKSIGCVYLPLELSALGTPLELEIFGERFPARVDADVLYDAPGKRVRA